MSPKWHHETHTVHSQLSTNYEAVSDVAVDADGNPHVIGLFQGDDFDPGDGTQIAVNGWFDVFVSNFNATGSLTWSRRVGGTGEDRRRALAIAETGDNQDRVAESLAESPTPGFTVWDIRGSWQAFDDLLLVAGVENFTDNNYQEHLDFHSQNGIRVFEPGVNFYFGTDLTY